MTDPNAPAPISGLLLIDKPLGRTSMDVCRVVRARLVAGGAPKRIKVGHGGTLDPLATGLVVVLVGRATKRCDEVMAGAKRYLAEIDLAHTSASDDLETAPEAVRGDEPPDDAGVRRACAGFVGEVMQTPPAHSAIKVGGRRAYEGARRGEAPALAPRPVRIDAIDPVEYDFPRLVLDVRCGKGVYVRSLARDLGRVLGTGGMLTALRRTEVAPFRLGDAVTIDDLPETLGASDLLDAGV